MRPRLAMLVTAAAVVLGALTGTFVLPERPAPPAASPGDVSPSPTTASPTPSPSPTPTPSPTPSPTRTPTPSPSSTPTTGLGPVSEDQLLSVSAFADAGLDVTVYPENGNTDPKGSVSACTDEREVGARTLSDLTGRDPAVLGVWTVKQNDSTVEEVLTTETTPAKAALAARHLVAAQTICQVQPVGHWVYGEAQSAELGPGVSATWFPYYGGKQNTTGTAPAGSRSCGGIAIAVNGAHFAVLQVYPCADADQLGQLAQAAAQALA